MTPGEGHAQDPPVADLLECAGRGVGPLLGRGRRMALADPRVWDPALYVCALAHRVPDPSRAPSAQTSQPGLGDGHPPGMVRCRPRGPTRPVANLPAPWYRRGRKDATGKHGEEGNAMRQILFGVLLGVIVATAGGAWAWSHTHQDRLERYLERQEQRQQQRDLQELFRQAEPRPLRPC